MSKKSKKNRIVPCTDANQHAREHAALIQRKQKYIAKKLEEARERYLKAQGMAAPNQSSTETIDTEKKKDDTSSETI